MENKKRKKNKYRTVDYWIINFNLTEEEALIKIKEYSAQSSRFNKQYWIKTGLTEDEAIKKVSEIQRNNSSKISKESRKKIGKNSAETRIKNGTSRSSSIFCKEYWINKGFFEEEAIEKISKNQTDNSLKFNEKRKENPERYSDISKTQLKYWLKKGFSEEEAKLALKERQQTFTLEKCIKRYGEEEGTKKWQERQEKWQNTLNSKSEEEKIKINKAKGFTYKDALDKYGKIWADNFIINKIENRTKNSGSLSKISQVLFKYLSVKYPDALFGKNEKKIVCNNKVYSLDFFINNKCIEFNGDYWHGNPLFYKADEYLIRKHCSVGEIWKNDKIRYENLKSIHNIDVLVIWENDFKKNKKEIIEKCLLFLEE